MKTEMYRKVGSSLYAWNEDQQAYVHVYLAAGKTKAQMIRAYENSYEEFGY